MSKISVIVPVYKVENFISACIESVLAQTYKDFELILVDDGSPDRSGEICEEYAKVDNRIKVFHKKNGGVSSARNFGVEKSRGELLCFVDSDDIIASTYLDDFEIGLEVDIYMQGYVKKRGDQIIEQHNFHNCRSQEFFDILSYAESNCIINSPCFKLFRRSIVLDHNVKFDSNISYGEDHLFSLEYVLHINSVHYSKASGYIYRLNEIKSLTQRVVPYREITYYALTAKKCHDKLCTREGGEAFKSAVGMTLMTNYVRTLKYLIKSEFHYTDFRWVEDHFIPELSVINIDFLSVKYRVLHFLTVRFTYPVIYVLIKYYPTAI